MSFKAILNYDGSRKDIRCLHVSYAFQRDVDATGRPSSEVRGGTIQFEIESTDDNSLFEWLCDAWKKKNGNILFYKREDSGKMKELKFEDAYLVEYSESIDSVGDNPMTQNFVISARKIDINGTAHENPWPDKG